MTLTSTCYDTGSPRGLGVGAARSTKRFELYHGHVAMKSNNLLNAFPFWLANFFLLSFPHLCLAIIVLE